MLYGDFKKEFRDNSDIAGEYKFDDTRTELGAKTINKPVSKKRFKLIRTVFVIILVLCICLSGVFLYFDLFNEDGIAGLLTCFSEKTEYIYCLSAGSFDTQQEAIALSDNLKEKGCAGFIHYNGLFNVLVSFYLNESDANTVSQKTNYTVYKVFKSSTLKNVPPNIKGEYEKCKNFDQQILEDLYNATEILEKNNDIVTCKQIITNTIIKTTSTTHEFVKNAGNINDINIQKYLSKVHSVISELNKLPNNLTLSSIRFTAIFIAITMS